MHCSTKSKSERTEHIWLNATWITLLANKIIALNSSQVHLLCIFNYITGYYGKRKKNSTVEAITWRANYVSIFSLNFLKPAHTNIIRGGAIHTVLFFIMDNTMRLYDFWLVSYSITSRLLFSPIVSHVNMEPSFVDQNTVFCIIQIRVFPFHKLFISRLQILC